MKKNLKECPNCESNKVVSDEATGTSIGWGVSNGEPTEKDDPNTYTYHFRCRGCGMTYDVQEQRGVYGVI